ncbi:MAG TPA: response regulator transcription factor [Anaerolineales bacterium]|nr:response regulator transcription factor [Anaerolineales bacterium]
MSPIRVLIADDHTLFRRGLVSLLNETKEFAVVGEANDGPESVRLTTRLRPDVLLMDVHMPGGGGVEAVQQLREVAPAVPVIMLTVSESDEDLLGAIRAGARGYFLKNAETEELYDGIRRAAAGEAVLDPALVERLFQHAARSGSPGADTPLSFRETEILRLVAEGFTNREVAARLSVSENTVKTHLARIFEKLGTTSRSEAAALARARGWLPLN